MRTGPLKDTSTKRPVQCGLRGWRAPAPLESLLFELLLLLFESLLLLVRAATTTARAASILRSMIVRIIGTIITGAADQPARRGSCDPNPDLDLEIVVTSNSKE